MADIIDIIQIGNTVLFLNPTPNWRNPPSGKYANDGLNKWTPNMSIKKMKIDTLNLLIRTNRLIEYILVVCYTVLRKFISDFKVNTLIGPKIIIPVIPVIITVQIIVTKLCNIIAF